MITIKWNDKQYKMPFDADYSRKKADKFKEEIIVKNRFNGEPRYYYHNMCTSEQRPLTEQQYNDSTYTLNT